MALVLSEVRGVGQWGGAEASEALSGSRKEEDGEHRSQVEAWEEEEALSYPEAQADLREAESITDHRLPGTEPYFSNLNMTHDFPLSGFTQFVTNIG